jgi:3-deoxy-manno-octulosonate cytidylyltransferase (CMP-KDO synthetase)
MSEPVQITAVIPARYGSTRFPGKPLALVKGISLLRRVWALAKAAPGIDQVLIATDDERVLAAARSFGAESVMTSPNLPNGTVRALAAVERASPLPTHVVNVQGDAILTPPWVIGSLARALRDDPEAAIVTPAVRMTRASYGQLLQAKKESPSSGTTVVFDHRRNALYFSKRVIPFLRDPSEEPPVHRHIGLYGYRLDALRRYVALPEGPLEKAEQLEQLRALENGLPVRVVLTDYRGRTHWSIDNPQDIVAAEKLIAAEGELLASYDGSLRWKD